MGTRAWIALSDDEENAIWARVYAELGFKPSIHQKDFPGFQEPAPSITYALPDRRGDGTAAEHAGLQEQAHEVFRQSVPAGDFIYALDWQHQGYKFYPSHDDTADTAAWKVPALPDGDYSLFVEKSLRFGWLGHPWEWTICVFGEPLLTAVKTHRPKSFRNPIRRKDLV